MKWQKRSSLSSLCMMVIITSALLFSCSDPGGDNGGFDVDYSTAFFSLARKAAPVFDAVASRNMTSRAVGDWTWGNPFYEIYNMLEDYDETMIDSGLDNIYNVLYDAGNFYEDMKTHAGEFDTAQDVAPSFDFNTTNASEYSSSESEASVIYSGGYLDTEFDRSFAYFTDGTKEYGLMTWNTETGESGIFQGYYDTATEDVEIHMMLYVDYEGTEDFSIRTWVNGNGLSGEFQCKMMKYTVGGYQLSLAGNGVSKGANEYFIFHVTDNENGASGGALDTYYKINAGDGKAELEVMDVLGSSYAEISSAENDPNAYAAGIPPNLYTVGDLATATTDFSNSNVLNLPAITLPADEEPAAP